MAKNKDYDFKVVQGDVFRITLKTNPSTGYSWHYTQQPDTGIVQFIKREQVEKPDTLEQNKMMVGQAIEEIWYFKGVGTGKTAIDLHYSRKPDAEEYAQTRHYAIKVKSP